jgi:hypothetical protein
MAKYRHLYSLRTAIFRDDLVEKCVGILEAVRNPARRAGRERVSNAGERNDVKSISRGQLALCISSKIPRDQAKEEIGKKKRSSGALQLRG